MEHTRSAPLEGIADPPQSGVTGSGRGLSCVSPSIVTAENMPLPVAVVLGDVVRDIASERRTDVGDDRPGVSGREQRSEKSFQEPHEVVRAISRTRCHGQRSIPRMRVGACRSPSFDPPRDRAHINGVSSRSSKNSHTRSVRCFYPKCRAGNILWSQDQWPWRSSLPMRHCMIFCD